MDIDMELFIYTLCQTLEKLGFMIKIYFLNLKYKPPTQELSKTEVNHSHMNTHKFWSKTGKTPNSWGKPQKEKIIIKRRISKIFLFNTEIISLPTLTDKFIHPKQQQIPRFLCKQTVVWSTVPFTRSCTELDRSAHLLYGFCTFCLPRESCHNSN